MTDEQTQSATSPASRIRSNKSANSKPVDLAATLFNMVEAALVKDKTHDDEGKKLMSYSSLVSRFHGVPIAVAYWIQAQFNAVSLKTSLKVKIELAVPSRFVFLTSSLSSSCLSSLVCCL